MKDIKGIQTQLTTIRKCGKHFWTMEKRNLGISTMSGMKGAFWRKKKY